MILAATVAYGQPATNDESAPALTLVRDQQVVSSGQAANEPPTQADGQISGVALDRNGRPLGGHTVRAVWVGGAARPRWQSLMVTTDDDGRFSVGGLPPGDYRLDVLSADTLITSRSTTFSGGTAQVMIREEREAIAESFEQLQELVKPGETINVTTEGYEVTGTITALSASSLTLLVNRTPWEVTEPQVLTIRQRQADSPADGAAVGALVGAAVLLVSASAMCAGDDGCMSDVAGSLLVAVGGGALIGLGIDAARHGSRVIYRRPQVSSATIAVSPVLSSRRQGVIVTVGFGGN